MIDQASQRKLALEICNAEPMKRSELWMKHHLSLPNSRFFFAVEGASPLGSLCNRTFSKGGALRSLFCRDKLVVLDEVLMPEMLRTGRVTYPVDYTIMLDTNAVSYIENVFTDRKAGIPKDFEEALTEIIVENLNFDGVLYRFENARIVDSPNATERIFRNLVAYESLRTVDRDHFIRTKQLKSTRSQQEVIKVAQELTSQLLYEKESGQFAEIEKIMPARWLYVILLKIAEIEFSQSRNRVAEKLRSLIAFMHEELATIFLGEAILANEFFKLGKEKLPFFGKVQAKNERLLSVLRNMAYDLQLIHLLELSLTFTLSEDAHFFCHSC